MMRISEFARTGNVTVRTLRFYDEAGLLRPAHVSSESGYRRYNPAQITELNRIQAFKDIGFALEEILDLLRRPMRTDELRQVLRERREVLRARVREDVGRLARIEARLSGLAAVGECYSAVLFGQTNEQWVASAREELANYEEADKLLSDLERKTEPSLLADGRAAIWHSCLESEGRIDCEAVCFLKGPMPTRRGVKTYVLAPARIAFAYHYGSEDSICRVYQSIANYVAERGYRLAGPKREVYWPAVGSRGERRSLTEIQFPIAKTRAAPHATRASAA